MIAVLLLVAGSYLGTQFWNAQEKPTTIVKAAFESEQVFAQVSANREWVLLGDEFTFRQKSIAFTVELSPEFSAAANSDISLSYSIPSTEKGGEMLREGTNRFSAEIFVGDLKPGSYTVVARVESPSGNFISQEVGFVVSYPLYVTWTLDWEGYDVKEDYLNAIDAIADKHGIPVTHFFNPRIYTSSAISKSRADYLTSWVIERKNSRGDEIGLHMHMFPDMVSAAGVIPHYEPAWGSTLKDGYDILASNYSYSDTVKMLEWSKKIFSQKGLGTPISFRAGGWFADEATLRAVQDTGFGLDSSGRTKYTFGENGVAGHWDLSATTHPYQLNAKNQNLIGSPTMDLWEFPDNGADSWAYSTEQLIDRFQANYSGKPLSDKQVVTYLSHPEWFWKDKPKIEALFTKLGKSANSADRGPVIYITLEKAYQIWAGR